MPWCDFIHLPSTLQAATCTNLKAKISVLRQRQRKLKYWTGLHRRGVRRKLPATPSTIITEIKCNQRPNPPSVSHDNLAHPNKFIWPTINSFRPSLQFCSTKNYWRFGARPTTKFQKLVFAATISCSRVFGSSSSHSHRRSCKLSR